MRFQAPSHAFQLVPREHLHVRVAVGPVDHDQGNVDALAAATRVHEMQRFEFGRCSGAEARVAYTVPLLGAFHVEPCNNVPVNVGVDNHEVVDLDVRGLPLQLPPLPLQPQLDGAVRSDLREPSAGAFLIHLNLVDEHGTQLVIAAPVTPLSQQVFLFQHCYSSARPSASMNRPASSYT